MVVEILLYYTQSPNLRALTNKTDSKMQNSLFLDKKGNFSFKILKFSIIIY